MTFLIFHSLLSGTMRDFNSFSFIHFTLFCLQQFGDDKLRYAFCMFNSNLKWRFKLLHYSSFLKFSTSPFSCSGNPKFQYLVTIARNPGCFVWVSTLLLWHLWYRECSQVRIIKYSTSVLFFHGTLL